MKKITVFALLLGMLCLLALNGCAVEKPDLSGNGRETENSFANRADANDDYAKTGIIERMSTVTEDDIKYISSAFDPITAKQLADALNSAAEHRADAPVDFYTFYDLTAYLSDFYSSDEEHFILRAGLEENFVNVLYRNGTEGSEEGIFSDSALYWLILNNYRTEENIETEYYNQYRDIIEARAGETVRNTKKRTALPHLLSTRLRVSNGLMSLKLTMGNTKSTSGMSLFP
jgi:hypothetical protein